MKKAFFTFLFLAMAVVACHPQSRPWKIYRPCPSSTTPAIVQIEKIGDINLTPCSGRSVLFNGSSAVPTISGTSRVNYFPYFSTANNLAKSPYSWNGTTYQWTDASFGGLFGMALNTQTSFGTFSVGETGVAIFQLNENAATAFINGDNSVRFDTTGEVDINSKGGHTIIGDVFNVSNHTQLQVSDEASQFVFQATGGSVQFSGINSFNYDHTITAGGTTGNATINKPTGTVNFAAGTSSLTLTNSTITANSIIFCVVRTNDTTATSCRVTAAGSGSATIRLNANATAETSVGFLAIN